MVIMMSKMMMCVCVLLHAYMYIWRVLSQNELSAIFDIFKVRASSYNTK